MGKSNTIHEVNLSLKNPTFLGGGRGFQLQNIFQNLSLYVKRSHISSSLSCSQRRLARNYMQIDPISKYGHQSLPIWLSFIRQHFTQRILLPNLTGIKPQLKGCKTHLLLHTMAWFYVIYSYVISKWRSIRSVGINQYDITMATHDITMGNDVGSDSHCKITMGNDLASDIHCEVTMSNDIAMCTYHGITIHNEPFLLYIFWSIPNYDFIMGSM